MTKAVVTTNTQPADDLIAFVDSQNEIVSDISEEVYNEVRQPSLSELKDTPPKPNRKIEWTSDAQRKYVMGFVLKKDANGNIIPYRRTGRMQNAWQFSFIDNGSGNIEMIYENPVSYTKFVVGTLAQNRGAALKFQQRFHRITGWFPAIDTAAFWMDTIVEEFAQRYEDRIGDFGKARSQRTYTG